MSFFQSIWSETDQSNLVIVMSAVIVILSLATLGYWLLRMVSVPMGEVSSQSLSKVASHIRFLWTMSAFFVLALLYSPNILILYIAFLTFLALKEFISITPTRRADRRVLFWAYLAIPCQFYFISQAWYAVFMVFLPVYIFAFIPMLMVLIGETQGFLKAFSVLSWGMMTTLFSLGHLAYLVVLPSEKNPVAGGLGFFLFLVILTQLNHITQYIFGKLFDYPQLRLKVSTTRNWASLLGSVGATALIAWLVAPLLTPLTNIEAIIAGLLIALGGFIGYIVMSAIKRDLRLIDRGSMTPGHGGVLNRIDMLMYNAPMFFYLVVS